MTTPLAILRGGTLAARHLDLLALLVTHGSLTGTQAARLLCTSPATLTRTGTRLEDHGLVERRIDTIDRRLIRWHPTAAGRTLMRQLA